MNKQTPKRHIYLRLKNEESDALKKFLEERKDSEVAKLLIEELGEADATYRKIGITICFQLEVGKAIELEKMLKQKVPTSEGGWTVLHLIRMDLMESIGACIRHAKEKGIIIPLGEDLATS